MRGKLAIVLAGTLLLGASGPARAASGTHPKLAPGAIGYVDPGLQQIQDDAQAQIDSNPNDPVAHVNMGNVYSDQGYYPQAASEFQQALKLKGNDFKAHVSMAYAYYKQGDRDHSIEWFKKALKINPKNAPTWASLAYVYEKNLEWKLAVQTYQQYLRLAPNGDDAKLARYSIKLLQEKLKKYGEPKPYAIPPE